MLKYIHKFKAHTVCPFDVNADVVKVNHFHIERLNEEMEDGDHVYLTVSFNGRYEILKYVKNGNLLRNEIPVTRDVEGTGRRNFPAGACLEIDWNKVQLDEYLASKG